MTLLPLSPASAQKPAPENGPERPGKSDADGDKLFDDLEADLSGKADSSRLPVIVTLREAATEARVRGLEKQAGRLAVGHRFGIVPAFSADVTKGQAQALARHADVVHVEADSRVQVTNATAQREFGVTAARAALPGLDGSGIKVAVIDTGVAGAHVDLTGRVVGFRDYVGGRIDAYDDNGHGTHVAATIAGGGVADPAAAGVAPAASLLVAKVLDAAGGGSMSNTTAAIDWAVSQGAQVVNLSLGAAGCADGSDATSQAVNNAVAQGVFVAVAAGNEGPGACTVGSPGAASGATTVAAMADTARGGYSLASFSSRGRAGTTGAARKPDITAPGVGIASADAFTANGYTTMSGTSMATPFVAGVGALMLDAGMPAGSLKSTMETTAMDWGAAGDDIEFGSGRLDAYRAVTGASDTTVRPGHAFRQSTLAGTGAQLDYQVTVQDTRFPIAAMLVHPSVTAAGSTSPDFDLHLFNPAGTEVARAYTSSRQETLAALPVATGTYTLRVRSYYGSGSYQLDVSAGGSVSTPTIKVSTTVAPASLSPTGDRTTLSADDNRYYTRSSTTSGTRYTSWVATFTGVPNDITGLTVTYKGKNSISCTQTVAIAQNGGWVQLFNGAVGTSEVAVTRTPGGAAKDYVAADQTVKVLLQCVSGSNFTTYGDLLTLRYDRLVPA
ncbi:MAG: S8 family serine peptidase [Actinomycetota bacterium]|nr:S8 family serine peptidase [Actinomycetota bacterium]